MMVSISIFVLITTIGIVNYRKFGNDIFITNLGYDIALSVRKAQSYGINVKEAKGLASGFTYAYGIHFARNNNQNSNQYTLFVDATDELGGGPNLHYDGKVILLDGVVIDESVEVFNLLKQSKITGLCVTVGNSAPDCDVGAIDITFLRPNPNARIVYKKNSPDVYLGPDNVKSATIKITSGDDRQKQVVIYSIGQISVQNVAS